MRRSGGPQPWGSPPGPPQPRGGKGKWIFAGIALLAVIAVTVVITVLVVGKDSGGGSPTPTNGNGSDIASANDKGPVAIITDDPTCDAWGGSPANTLRNQTLSNGVTGIRQCRLLPGILSSEACTKLLVRQRAAPPTKPSIW